MKERTFEETYLHPDEVPGELTILIAQCARHFLRLMKKKNGDRLERPSPSLGLA